MSENPEIEIAILKTQVMDLSRRITITEGKIDALTEFKNKALGWSLVASFLASAIASGIQIFMK